MKLKNKHKGGNDKKLKPHLVTSKRFGHIVEVTSIPYRKFQIFPSNIHKFYFKINTCVGKQTENKLRSQKTRTSKIMASNNFDGQETSIPIILLPQCSQRLNFRI